MSAESPHPADSEFPAGVPELNNEEASCLPARSANPEVSELLPAHLVFLETGEAEPVASSPSLVPRDCGPGIWESIAWMAGVHLIQAMVVVVTIGGLIGLYLFNHDFALPSAPDGTGHGSVPGMLQGLRSFMPFLERNLAIVLGVAGLATVLYGAFAVSLRLRKQGGLTGLGWRLPAPGHLGLILMATVPLSLLCTELQKLMFTITPQSEGEMAQLFSQLSEAPLAVILLAIAFAPAFGEELIFRGLIGRGLIARMGIVRGILVTSVLFGIMHLNPAQSVAVIPLGAAMHFVYLATRSFWAPILVHLFNNSLAAILLKYESQIPLARLLDSQGTMPLHLLTVSAALVTVIGLLFWQTRVQYMTAEGRPLDSWWPVGGAVPADESAIEVRLTPQPLLLACGAFNSLGFVAVLYQQAIRL
jgi:membrane protease YdiL (CAAX protease family)